MNSPGLCRVVGVSNHMGFSLWAVQFGSVGHDSGIEKHLSSCLPLVSRYLCEDGERTCVRGHRKKKKKKAPELQVV
jgi:hypothetical protein